MSDKRTRGCRLVIFLWPLLINLRKVIVVFNYLLGPVFLLDKTEHVAITNVSSSSVNWKVKRIATFLLKVTSSWMYQTHPHLSRLVPFINFPQPWSLVGDHILWYFSTTGSKLKHFQGLFTLPRSTRLDVKVSPRCCFTYNRNFQGVHRRNRASPVG